MSRDPFLPLTVTTASKAASATHMSEGCVATQLSRGAEHGVVAVEAVARVAAVARNALIAARGVVVEIEAAGALHEIAADRRHVADLGGGAGQDRLGEQGKTLAHTPIGRDGGVLHAGADPQAPAFGLLDIAGEAGHVHQHIGMLDGLAHQIDKIGAAAEILGAGARSGRKRRAHVGGALVLK